MALAFHALTPERWPDLERLFGPSGAYSNCWCMFWRLKSAEFSAWSGARKREAFHDVVERGPAPGILAYDGGEPVAWCAVAPREVTPRLDRSPTLRRVDDEPVWSLTCFFVARAHRGQGMMARLLEGAAAHARAHGATLLEGYPVEPREGLPGCEGYTGIVGAFRKAGFRKVADGGARQLVMRKRLD